MNAPALTTPEPGSAASNAVLDMDITCLLIMRDAERVQKAFREAWDAPHGEARDAALAEARYNCKGVADGLRNIKNWGYLEPETCPLPKRALLAEQAV